MLEKCCESFVRNLDSAFARIWTLNERSNMLELQASAGMYSHTDGGHSRDPVGTHKIGAIADLSDCEPGFFPDEELTTIFSRVRETGEPFTGFSTPISFPNQSEDGET